MDYQRALPARSYSLCFSFVNADAAEMLAHVAVEAEHLEAVRHPVLVEPSVEVNTGLATIAEQLGAMLGATPVDVVDSEEVNMVNAAARAHATVAEHDVALELGVLLATPCLAILASLTAGLGFSAYTAEAGKP